MEVKEIIRTLSAVSAPSGREEKAAEIIREMVSPFCGKIYTDALGNVVGIKKGSSGFGVKVLIEAHMDEVGFTVTSVEEGFVRFALVGGVDKRMLPGREVTILAEKPIYGVIACLPPHVLSAEEREKAIEVKDMYIDIGMTQERAAELVKPGTFGVFKGEALDLACGNICGKAFDDRACVAILIKTMEMLSQEKLDYDLYFMASTQEEMGMRGAQPGAFGIAPDYCISLDVTHASTPDASAFETYKAGCGAVIDVGPNMNRRMSDSLINYCKLNSIPYEIEVDPKSSGTNAWPIQVSREGVVTAVLSVPLKYMHSPVETLRLSDAEASVKLLSGFLKSFVPGGECNA